MYQIESLSSVLLTSGLLGENVTIFCICIARIHPWTIRVLFSTWRRIINIFKPTLFGGYIPEIWKLIQEIQRSVLLDSLLVSSILSEFSIYIHFFLSVSLISVCVWTLSLDMGYSHIFTEKINLKFIQFSTTVKSIIYNYIVSSLTIAYQPFSVDHEKNNCNKNPILNKELKTEESMAVENTASLEERKPDIWQETQCLRIEAGSLQLSGKNTLSMV